jgi:hypothetical protein
MDDLDALYQSHLYSDEGAPIGAVPDAAHWRLRLLRWN